MRNESEIYALVLGRTLASLREQRGWTQGDLASRVGITQSNLSRIERGQAQPDAYTQRQLAEAFGMSASALTHLVDSGFERARQAAAAASQKCDDDEPWWKVALKVAGGVGLAGIVAFAVGAAITALLEGEDEAPAEEQAD